MEMNRHYLEQVYNNILSSGDLRSNKYLFIRSPVYVVVALCSYLLIVLYGPRVMEKRNAFQLRGVLIGYNLFSVLFSFWMTWEFFACSVLNPKFNLLCEDIHPTDRSTTTIRMIDVHWWYFFSKIIEFLDTIFFVLRKKNNQISFLHVYHHGSMLILQWSLVKYVPGGASYFGPMCNCFIHTLMYAYYMLSAFGPHMQKYLWWKKYLTTMQMTQFILIIGETFLCTMFCDFKAKYANFFFVLHWIYLVTLYFLFQRFFNMAYKKKDTVTVNGHTKTLANGTIHKKDVANGNLSPKNGIAHLKEQ